jgi:hypothetical protein
MRWRVTASQHEDKTPSSQSAPSRSAVTPLSGLVAVAKRPEVLDVEANLWL